MNKVIEQIHERSKSCQEADFIANVFGGMGQEAVQGRVPVVLYGAGSAGEHLLPVFRMHGVHPACFCDSNPARAGQTHCGLPIISLSELRREHQGSLIVVTTGTYREQVKQQLTGDGFDQEKVLTVENQEALYYYTHVAQWYWSQEDLLAHADELLQTFELLSDQRSREIFISRIALFARGADYRSYRSFIAQFSDVAMAEAADLQAAVAESYLQFNNDLIALADGELLVDGGAFTGDSTLEFASACARKNLEYRKAICFEPDPRIFAQLQKNTATLRDISHRPLGLWSHAATISFASSDLLQPGSTRILSESELALVDDAAGTMEITTASIDEECAGEPVTIIKMDIEGAEMAALRGARETIVRCRPKLIISAYHKRDDLFEIPLLIHQIVPAYNFYLRHFGKDFGETTLFAIPRAAGEERC